MGLAVRDQFTSVLILGLENIGYLLGLGVHGRTGGLAAEAC